MSLQRALLLLTAAALFAGIVPTGVVMDRRIAREVERRTREDLAQAPRLLKDRNVAQAEGMLMHAREVARSPALIEALKKNDRDAAIQSAERVRNHFGDGSIIVNGRGEAIAGPALDSGLLATIKNGKALAVVLADSGALHFVAMESVTRGNKWLGAAGITVALNQSMAGTLAGLTRSDVLILGMGGQLLASTPVGTISTALASHAARLPHDGQSRMVTLGTQQYLINSVALGNIGTIVFLRDLTQDLAVLPRFRRLVLWSSVAAVLIGLLLGTLVASRISRPVTALADAADRFAAGDVSAPLMRSSIQEIDRLSDAFETMRKALSARITDVTGANRRLTDRQARFETSQSEILQRERYAVSSRVVAELSHEIRNPIANLRNCLEVIRRRMKDDAQGREFTDLAIDELLRMHELAEQLLDLNRPRDPALRAANVDQVLQDVALLCSVGWVEGAATVTVGTTTDGVPAAIAPDALKQVLLNLVQNAREALGDVARTTSADAPRDQKNEHRVVIASRSESDRVLIEVSDNGPGISADVLPHVFDPFFTTKGAVHGVGLGLFVAEGLLRTAGGRITASNRPEGGASFLVELPIASV